jgi:hypothetical protein
MSKIDKDTVIDNFTKAYTKANGKAPSIEVKGGWYSIDGEKNVRLAQLETMTTELSGGKSAQTAEPSLVKAEPKPSAAQKPIARASTKTSQNKQKSAPRDKTFSVRDFYTQQILEVNPGAKPPR